MPPDVCPSLLTGGHHGEVQHFQSEVAVGEVAGLVGVHHGGFAVGGAVVGRRIAVVAVAGQGGWLGGGGGVVQVEDGGAVGVKVVHIPGSLLIHKVDGPVALAESAELIGLVGEVMDLGRELVNLARPWQPIIRLGGVDDDVVLLTITVLVLLEVGQLDTAADHARVAGWQVLAGGLLDIGLHNPPRCVDHHKGGLPDDPQDPQAEPFGGGTVCRCA